MPFLPPCHWTWKSLNPFSLLHSLLNLANSSWAVILPQLSPSNFSRHLVSLQSHNKQRIFLLAQLAHCIVRITLSLLPLLWAYSYSFFNPQNLVVSLMTRGKPNKIVGQIPSTSFSIRGNWSICKWSELMKCRWKMAKSRGSPGGDR